MSDLVGIPEDRFSCVAAHFVHCKAGVKLVGFTFIVGCLM